MKKFKTINVVPVTENIYNNIEAIYDKVLLIDELLLVGGYTDLELDLLYNMVSNVEFEELCQGLIFTGIIGTMLYKYHEVEEIEKIEENENIFSYNSHFLYVNYFQNLLMSKFKNNYIKKEIIKDFINNYNTYNEIKIYKDTLFVKVDLEFFNLLKNFININSINDRIIINDNNTDNKIIIKKLFKFYLNTITNKVNIVTEKLNSKTLTLYNSIYLKM